VFPKSQSIIIVYGIGMYMQNHAKKWFNNTSSTNAMAAIAIGAMLVFSVAGTKAFADVVHENIVNADATDNTVTEGQKVEIKYWITQEPATQDTQGGCNIGGGTSDTINLSFDSNILSGPSSVTIDDCGPSSGKTATFTALQAGQASVSVSSVTDNNAGSGTYKTTGTTETITVEEDTPTDTTAPEVTSITVNDDLISEADVGSGSFEVVVTYNEAMNTNTNPTIAFDPSVTSTLSGGSGAWSSSDTVFTATYDVADGNVEEQKDVDVSVSGAKDVAGNTQVSKTTADLFGIDTIAPQGIVFSGITDGQTFYFSDPLPTVTCSADDDSFGPVTCDVTPQSLPTTVATHTLTATAEDTAGNSATATITYIVNPWTLKGFYQPVDMNGVYNVVKAGSTVPLKFEVFKGSTELTDIGVRDTVTQKKVTCDTAATVDEIEQYTTTGQTTFRYDTSGGQFIDNWKSPTTKNACYQVTMTFDDGSSLVALFKTK
jgi:hypothetical protein